MINGRRRRRPTFVSFGHKSAQIAVAKARGRGGRGDRRRTASAADDSVRIEKEEGS